MASLRALARLFTTSIHAATTKHPREKHLKRNIRLVSSKSEIAFPYPANERQRLEPASRTVTHKLLSRWRTLRTRKKPSGTRLIPLNPDGIKPLAASDIPLIFLTRNSLRFLESFLTHYRGLGVTRFLCVDDQSTDGTREKLLNEPDVDLFGSDVRYREAKGGLMWREALVGLYGTQRWYLNVDCDEYLVYGGCETKKLPEFIQRLEAAGILHCPAPMIDFYPEDSISSAVFDGSNNSMPWTIANMFDRSGYRLFRTSSGMIMSGGPRDRVLGRPAIHDELMKYPLVYVEHDTTFSVSIHKPWPFTRNFSPIVGSLLHFKFFNETESLIKEAIRDNQYYKGSRSYKSMLKALDEGKLVNLKSDISVHYENSRQLEQLGFFKTLF
ncbi:glycosyltransferase family 2 protein [Phyllobacterium sp. 0TCS1.6C]|nr:glycosyltransferase family 2 protein [Phyllobacterium sp. 0TCS1.6C]MCX8280341.1 glycosyltransferase family 2 protein [Phyllobacterium sp. 0TCS1.6C]MCX8295210.1 glycosyltransferase family 2 protein [Phyllobacterium sp. 0TCS1.6A]